MAKFILENITDLKVKKLEFNGRIYITENIKLILNDLYFNLRVPTKQFLIGCELN
jgi:hypothetical protein